MHVPAQLSASHLRLQSLSQKAPRKFAPLGRIRNCILPFALGASLLASQSVAPTHAHKGLSPAALAKLHTLATLNSLPGGAWHFHAGDLPHGESPALDDSAWPLVPMPAAHHSVTAPNDAVWYRREITVPKTLHGYDITGSQVLFQFHANANGPVPQIIYFNGRRVALGDDLEPIVLFDPAKPGEKVLVAVKLLHTVDVKSFNGVSLRIVPNPDATGPHRPNPGDIRTQCLTAANLLPALPHPRLDLLPRVEAAVDAIDTHALATADQAAFDASLRRAQTILSTLHPVLAQAMLDLDGNSHIDAAWLWPRSETINVVRDTFTTALQLMNEYPNYVFTQSAAQYTEWMADKYPALNDQIRQRVKEGRWEIVGGMWVEPDLNLPGGESLVRQLLVGQRYFQKEYGVTARIGWNPDSFGYNWQLPQIYKRSGIHYFVTQKMHWNDTNQLPFRLFWWESPDGSKVLTYFPTDYVHRDLDPNRLSADFAQSAERNPGTTEHLDLYGIGDHGGGPTRSILDQGVHWIDAGKSAAANAPDAVPTMRFSTAQRYFDDVQSNLNPTSPTWNYKSIAQGYTAPPAAANGAIGIPTWKDELYLEFHRGVYTTQAMQKANIRRSESTTLDAEKLASLAWLDGTSYPDNELNTDWEKITFNQFHDLAAGSGIATIYRDAQDDFTQVFNSDHNILMASRNTLDPRIDTRVKSGVPVIVYNTLAWPRSETVKLKIQLPEAASSVALFDSQDHRLLSQIVSTDAAIHQFTVLARVDDVPPLGYTVLHAIPETGRPPHYSEDLAPLTLGQNPQSYILASLKIEITINKQTGCITSLTSRPANTEFFAPGACANQLQTFVDKPKQYDAWNIDYGTLDHPVPISALDSITVLTDGPLRKTIRITRTWDKSHFIQDISLDLGADAVVVSNTVDWHEQHILLKAAFPLAASSPDATYEIPFGSIERPTTRNSSWEKAKFEVPALRWADLGGSVGGAHQGVSILNDSKYGYDGLGNTLRLTLLRSPTFPDPHADQGLQHFRYAIYPHTGTWKQALTVRQGYDFNDPLTAQQVFAHSGELPPTHSFISLDNPNVVLSAVKKAEDSNALVFRMYEWAGKASTVKLHIPPHARYAVESNLMEKVEGPHLSLASDAADDTVTVPIKPYEILTLQVFYAAPSMASK